jgi:hypothetical protein
MKQGRIHIIQYIIVCSLLFVCLQLVAQEKVMVASKTITREFGSGITSLIITAEKSDIIMNPSPDERIRVEIKLLAKNPDQQIAFNDLKAVGYEIKEEPGVLRLKNYFQPPGEKPIKSNLSVKYTISVPASVIVQIHCLYSTISMQTITTNCTISAGFSDVAVTRCQGQVTLRTYYTGITIEEGNAVLSGSLDKSDMTLTNYSGPVNMTSNYGQISITQNRNHAGIRLTGSYTEFSLTVPHGQLNNCQLSAVSGTIDAPPEFFDIIKKEKNRTTMSSTNDPSSALINISTTYNTIRLYETKK